MRTTKHIRPREVRRGAALVEMALVLPIFVAVTLGIVEFGRAMMVGNLVTNAAREGARLGIIDGTTNAEVAQAVRDFLSTAANVLPADVSVTVTVTEYTGNPAAANEVGNANTRDLVTVNVQLPYNKVSYIQPKFLSGKNLTSTAAMRHE